MIKAKLPYPPSVNHYWRSVVRKGRVVTYVNDDGKAYRRRVRAILTGVPRLTGRLRVWIVVRPPDRRSRDLDNLCKSLLDSLTAAGVWDDDDQVDELMIIRHQQADGGVVEVAVSEIMPEGGVVQ